MAAEHSEVTPDGSPVAVYLALDAEPAFTPVLERLGPPARVLDLGCGVGRLANVLAARGLDVVGVDESAEMLNHLDPAVEAVQGQIEDLELGRRFDAVVLASHFLNVADLDQRRALLKTCARHLADSGRVFLERYEPNWAREVTATDATVGEVRVRLTVLARRGDEFDGRVVYDLDGAQWTQEFTASVVDDREAEEALAQVGLRLAEIVGGTWLVAVKAGDTGS